MSRNVVARLVALVVLLAATAGTSLVGCTSAPESVLGAEVHHGQATVVVQSARLHHPVFETPTGAQRSAQPVLEVALRVTNTGDGPLRYDLGFGSSAGTQATTALLFEDRGALPPSTSDHIASLQLAGQTYPEDPVTTAQTLAPGESLDDILLFTAVAPSTALVLSLPPRIFGADARTPVWVRFRAPGLEEPPAPASVGDAVPLGGATVTLLGAEGVWVPLTDARAGEGFSDGPVLRLRVRVENTSEVGLTVHPARSTSVDAPRLLDAQGELVPRLSLPTTVSAQGQVNERRQLPPGRSLEDFFLFQLPEAGDLTFEVAGKRFGTHGLARFAWSWTPGEIEVPEPFREVAESDEDAD